MSDRRRARVPLALLLAGLLGIAAACSAGTPSVPQATDPGGTTQLILEVYGPPQVVSAYVSIAANYSALHPNTVVNVRPYTSAAAAVDALADEPVREEPDAFLVPASAVPSLMAQKAIAPVGDLLADRQVDFGDGYQRAALDAFSFDKQLQCMPVDDSPLVVYYNTDLIDMATLTATGNSPIDPADGWSLDQFEAAAKQAARHGNGGVYVEPSLEQLAPFVWSGGGDVVDNDTDPTTLRLADGSAETALRKILFILRNPALTFTKDELVTSSALDRFKSGSLGMILGYRSLTPQLRAQADLHFDVMPLPKVGGQATVGQTSGLCLSAHAGNEARTADFLAYAASDAASALLARTGYTVPPNLDVVNSADFTQPGLQPAAADVFAANVRYQRPLPTVATWPEVAAEAGPLLSGLFYDSVIEPFTERLQAIDNSSLPIFTPGATPSP